MTVAAHKMQPFPPGFLTARRPVLLTLGLMYATYYTGRFNLLSVANKTLTTEFGWRADEWGLIINATLWAYAAGQIINGIRVDRAGGRRMMLIGAIGIVAVNVLLGFGMFVRTLSYFVGMGVLLGFFQAHGAPSLVKICASWMRVNERGTFTGIFGAVIQCGRWAILLGGGWLVANAPWPWLFWVPAILIAVTAAVFYFVVKNNPEDLGLPPAEAEDVGHGIEDTAPLRVGEIIRKVATNKIIWMLAAAYFCTGVIRWGVDSWYIRYLQETYNMRTDSFTYIVSAFLIPLSAVAGSFLAGFSSDRLFGARRGPAAALMYFMSFVMLLLFLYFPGPILSVAFLVILQMFINGPHSLLGGAAAMDFGGRKAAGFATGLIDACQYLGGGLFAGSIIGAIMQSYGTIPGTTNITPEGWQAWIVVLMGFTLLGGVLMTVMWNARPETQLNRQLRDTERTP
jgi:OPA family glycerol-3-phosphate transporter-like MFS transporter